MREIDFFWNLKFIENDLVAPIMEKPFFHFRLDITLRCQINRKGGTMSKSRQGRDMQIRAKCVKQLEEF